MLCGFILPFQLAFSASNCLIMNRLLSTGLFKILEPSDLDIGEFYVVQEHTPYDWFWSSKIVKGSSTIIVSLLWDGTSHPLDTPERAKKTLALEHTRDLLDPSPPTSLPCPRWWARSRLPAYPQMSVGAKISTMKGKGMISIAIKLAYLKLIKLVSKSL